MTDEMYEKIKTAVDKALDKWQAERLVQLRDTLENIEKHCLDRLSKEREDELIKRRASRALANNNEQPNLNAGGQNELGDEENQVESEDELDEYEEKLFPPMTKINGESSQNEPPTLKGFLYLTIQHISLRTLLPNTFFSMTKLARNPFIAVDRKTIIESGHVEMLCRKDHKNMNIVEEMVDEILLEKAVKKDRLKQTDRKKTRLQNFVQKLAAKNQVFEIRKSVIVENTQNLSIIAKYAKNNLSFGETSKENAIMEVKIGGTSNFELPIVKIEPPENDPILDNQNNDQKMNAEDLINLLPNAPNHSPKKSQSPRKRKAPNWWVGLALNRREQPPQPLMKRRRSGF